MKNLENENFCFYIKTQTIEIFNELKALYNDQEPSHATGARCVDRVSIEDEVKVI
jgi:hypothetical protein